MVLPGQPPASRYRPRAMRSVAFWTAALVVATLVVTATQTPELFDVVSIKAMGPASAEALARFGSGCDGSFPRLENRRFTVATTAYALITWAYGFNKYGGCGFVTNGNFITGGPSWIRTERFEVQGVMPESAPDPSIGAFLNGEALVLEAMLRGMLADRFKLAAHRETRDAPVYALVAARGGARLPAAKADDRMGYGISRRPDANGLPVDHLVVANGNMTYIAIMLGIITKRPVVDRTGLTGTYSFDLPFAPQEVKAGDTSAASLFTALQEQLGLRLEDTRAPVEILVIDRADKPSEN
jgi:uncharacterized protein (TIGR03435 family)